MHKWMCENPAKLAGLQNKKSKLVRGYDADIVIWDPEHEIQVISSSVMQSQLIIIVSTVSSVNSVCNNALTKDDLQSQLIIIVSTVSSVNSVCNK
jgi:cytosine/adenosine deaminase-related metal-dependent hydrolase